VPTASIGAAARAEELVEPPQVFIYSLSNRVVSSIHMPLSGKQAVKKL
jgi:hypothetical protein